MARVPYQRQMGENSKYGAITRIIMLFTFYHSRFIFSMRIFVSYHLGGIFIFLNSKKNVNLNKLCFLLMNRNPGDFNFKWLMRIYMSFTATTQFSHIFSCNSYQQLLTA